MPRLGARAAAYIVAGILALWFSYDLMRKPIQVSDSLQELLDVQASPSSQLRDDALETHVTNLNLLPRWADRWWGE